MEGVPHPFRTWKGTTTCALVTMVPLGSIITPLPEAPTSPRVDRRLSDRFTTEGEALSAASAMEFTVKSLAGGAVAASACASLGCWGFGRRQPIASAPAHSPSARWAVRPSDSELAAPACVCGFQPVLSAPPTTRAELANLRTAAATEACVDTADMPSVRTHIIPKASLCLNQEDPNPRQRLSYTPASNAWSLTWCGRTPTWLLPKRSSKVCAVSVQPLTDERV
jgi:hypothetical protein